MNRPPHLVARWCGLVCLLAASIAGACGSSDDKKKVHAPSANVAGGGAAGAPGGANDDPIGGMRGEALGGAAQTPDDAPPGGAAAVMGGAGAASGLGGDGGGTGGAGSAGGPPDGPEVDHVVWADGFENGFGDWSIEGGVWTIGAPTAATAPKPYEGSALAGMGLAGNYTGVHDARLVSPMFEVPAASEHPRFKYAFWYSFGVNGPNVDKGQLQIKIKGGAWVDVADDLLSSYNAAWSQRVLDLSEYAGQTIQVGFRALTTGSPTAPGWFIDAVSLETGDMRLTGSFDGDPGDWSVQGGLFAFGASKVANAPQPFAGSGAAGTSLATVYSGAHDSRLVSPAFVVPAADEWPRFRFQYWYQLGVNGPNIDYGQLQIKVDGQAWQDVLGDRFRVLGDSWRQRIVDLRAYAGQRVQLALRIVTTGSAQGHGCYVDEAKLETGAFGLDSPEGFENGAANWSVEGGVWTFGTPTFASAPSPLGGTALAGTMLTAGYSGTQSARLVSPPFTVPSAAVNPRFKYGYWYSLGVNGPNIDSGQLQIRLDAAEWTDVVGEKITTSSGGWGQRVIDLSPYAGQTLQVGFRFNATGPAPGIGWYIDNVSLQTD